MTVTLGTTPHSNWHRLVPLLEALGCANPERSSLEQWYTQDAIPSEGYLLLAYDSPQQTLVAAMEQGVAPAEVLLQWEDCARAMIKVFKANRRRTVLINVDTASHDLKQAAGSLSTHWQKSIELPETDERAQQPANAYYQMLAALAVHQSPELQALLAKLQACTLPLTEEELCQTPAQDIDALYSGLQTLWQESERAKDLQAKHQTLQNEKTAQEHALKKLKDENQLLLESLQKVQVESEKQVQKNNKIQKDVAALQSELQRWKKNHKTLEEEVSAAHAEKKALIAKQETQQAEWQQALTQQKEESTLLLNQLHMVQEEFERRVVSSQNTDAELVKKINELKEIKATLAKDKDALKKQQLANKKIVAENATLEGQLKGIKASSEELRSEKERQGKELSSLQKKLEILNASLKQKEDENHQRENRSQQQLNESKEEAVLLLQQLHIVQESYEKLFNENALLKDKYAELFNGVKQLTESEGLPAIAEAHEADEPKSLISQLKQHINSLHKLQDQLQQSKIDQTFWRRKLYKAQEQLNYSNAEKASVQKTLDQTKEQLEKDSLDKAFLRQEIEKHQQELNILRTSSQQYIHYLERLIQWLRVHAQRHAAAAYREIRSYKKTLPKQAAMLEASQFFDADWYCEQYPDVANSGLKPAEHFIKFGAIDGRNPGPMFDTGFYLTQYEDVTASGQHPLLHYLSYGITEQRETQPEQRRLPAPQTPAEEGK